MLHAVHASCQYTVILGVFGVFARSVYVKLLLNIHGRSSADEVPLYASTHPPSSRIRIVLLDVKCGIRNVSQSQTASRWPINGALQFPWLLDRTEDATRHVSLSVSA